MSWHKTHRTTFIYQAVLASLFGMVSLSASAMNLGQANIKSAQHEPLSATINVTNIDAANFHASVASSDIYRQMGLSADAQISVTFTPTSNNAGQITLTSNKPITTPFADVVLNLNNNGKQVIEPQTLLMPLSANNAFVLPDDKATQVVTAETKPNLPEVSPTAEPIIIHETVQIDEPIVESETTPLVTQSMNDPETTPDSLVSEDTILSKEKTVLSQLTPEGTNKQINILTEEIVRRPISAGQTSTPILTQEPSTQEEPIIAQDRVDEASSSQASDTTMDAQTGDAVYVVQHGDSLWAIANTIAKANNMQINEVMNAIHEANPDAFNKGNASHLKTNASLSLPNYQVIPSQKAIAEAINANRENSKKAMVASKKSTKKSDRTTGKALKADASKRSSQITAKPAQKALPKAQMTLVTPTQQGKATGTNNKSTPSAVAGGNNLANTLKTTRQQTAEHAKRVNSLNQELSSAAKKVQLQNQKLADLENRLKSLKENK